MILAIALLVKLASQKVIQQTRCVMNAKLMSTVQMGHLPALLALQIQWAQLLQQVHLPASVFLAIFLLLQMLHCASLAQQASGKTPMAAQNVWRVLQASSKKTWVRLRILVTSALRFLPAR